LQPRLLDRLWGFDKGEGMNIIYSYLEDLKRTLDTLPRDRIQQVIDILHEARLNKRQVFILGNGGSASTASHFVCDLAKNTRAKSYPNFKVIGLTDNMAIFSALANDDGYENVFADQLASYVQPGDVVIGISTSGNSPNVLRAIQLANTIPAKTIGFTGYDSGQLGMLADVDLHVPSDCIEHVEDIHLVLEHLICKALRERGMENDLLEQALTVLPGVPIQEESSALD
jgi:D-sedoheptulose 7-phosphate isomerase